MTYRPICYLPALCYDGVYISHKHKIIYMHVYMCIYVCVYTGAADVG